MDINIIVENYFNKKLKKVLSKAPENILADAQEIRLRANKPFYIISKGREYFFSKDGFECGIKDSYVVSKEDIGQTLEMMSEYSIYAFNEEIKKGYLSLQGGVRVGIVGKTVIEYNSIRTIKNISGLNIRISKEVKGCSNKILKFLGDEEFKHTLIISPPGCGKTTLLRDLVRNLSDGGFSVGLVDERSEIAGTYLGTVQMDVGYRTDVLDSCPKADGMKMLLRSMAPQIIVADEIGSDEDLVAINDVINGGVKLICTLHGNSILDTRKKTVIDRVFERYIVLSNRNGVGTIEGIYDEGKKNIWLLD